MSPSRFENSSNTISRSASRSRCSTTCFAVCAAMRPAVARVYLLQEDVAQHHVGLLAPRLDETDLRGGVFYLLHDRVLHVDVVIAGVAVDAHGHVALEFDVLLVSGYEGGLHRLEHHLLGQILLRRQLSDGDHEFTFHAGTTSVWRRTPRLTPRYGGDKRVVPRRSQTPPTPQPGRSKGQKKVGATPLNHESVFTFATISLLINDYKGEGAASVETGASCRSSFGSFAFSRCPSTGEVWVISFGNFACLGQDVCF